MEKFEYYSGIRHSAWGTHWYASDVSVSSSDDFPTYRWLSTNEYSGVNYYISEISLLILAEVKLYVFFIKAKAMFRENKYIRIRQYYLMSKIADFC